MQLWRVDFDRTAERDLKALDTPIRRRTIDKIDWLIENFDQLEPLPLDEPWVGFFKLRVGDWRVIYKIKHPSRTITVHYIDHRSKIYKRIK